MRPSPGAPAVDTASGDLSVSRPRTRPRPPASAPAHEDADKATAIRLPTNIEHAARTYADAIGISLNALVAVSVHSCLSGLAAPAPQAAASAPTGAEINKRRQLIRLTPFIEAAAELHAAEGEPLRIFVARCVEGYLERLETSSMAVPSDFQLRLRLSRQP